MNNEKVTKAKLYTFAEMKELIIEAISEVALESLGDKDCEDPGGVTLMESIVGAKILTKIDEMRERGEA